jgi:hypothetical protein
MCGYDKYCMKDIISVRYYVLDFGCEVILLPYRIPRYWHTFQK